MVSFSNFRKKAPKGFVFGGLTPLNFQVRSRSLRGQASQVLFEKLYSVLGILDNMQREGWGSIVSQI